MAKTSKTVPQKEKASSSRPSGDKAPVEPPPREYVLGPSAPWMPQVVPDLEDWVRKLASTSSYAERAWRDLAKGVTKDAVLRPSSIEEGTKSPVPEPGKDKKRKAISWSEDHKPKTRRVRRKAITISTDSVQRLIEEKEEDDASTLVIRSVKAIEVARPSKLMTPLASFESTSASVRSSFRRSRGERCSAASLSQKDEVIKDLQADLAKAREEEAELDKQASLVLLEYGFDPTVEANPSLSQLLQKVEKIGLLREEVDQIKAECDRWNETIDRLAIEKETILAKLLSADVQLRSVKQKGSAQAKRIEELETRLAEARAEIESSKVMADKSIAVYRADAEAAQMEMFS
ncbi:uncharacterized protein [Nicotiana tomentosiformis]|uniref:uncharacterized protein n=1 Tax=Nicotiana tomentosiformis TaxID=4098 RepID=UPI00388C77BA